MFQLSFHCNVSITQQINLELFLPYFEEQKIWLSSRKEAYKDLNQEGE